MPFASESQRRYLWMKHPSVAKEFASKTPKDAKLPEHVAGGKGKMGRVMKHLAKKRKR